MAIVINADAIRSFLTEVGNQHPHAARLYLLGGGALLLMGSSRPTLDLDYLGHDLDKDALQTTIDRIAAEMQIDVDAVPLNEFVPIPHDAAERHQFYGRFGSLEAYLFDPLTISLSKLDRGFDVDLDDILFLIQSGHIEIRDLEQVVQEALHRSTDFDLDRATITKNMSTIRKELNAV